MHLQGYKYNEIAENLGLKAWNSEKQNILYKEKANGVSGEGLSMICMGFES
jgi:hypothetical protein